MDPVEALQEQLSAAIDACNDLGRTAMDSILAKDYAALAAAEAERETARLRGAVDMAAESRDMWKRRAIEAGWEPSVGLFPDDTPAEPWNPASPDGTRPALGEAVGQALGTASMCWSNVRAAGVFDDAACLRVYHGLMAYLADWGHEVARQANEATAAKLGGPRRGDVVEDWIKRHRDQFRDDYDPDSNLSGHVLDRLLDDYRGHADTGTPLDREVQGPHPEED